MNRQEIDPFASPADLPFDRQVSPVSSREIPKLWVPPPSPVSLRVLALLIPVVTLFGVPIALRANGETPGAALFETLLIVVGEAIALWFVFAIRCAYLEGKYAPTQHHYRRRLMTGFVVLVVALLVVLVAVVVIVFAILLLAMGRSSRNSRRNAWG